MKSVNVNSNVINRTKLPVLQHILDSCHFLQSSYNTDFFHKCQSSFCDYRLGLAAKNPVSRHFVFKYFHSAV
jgi:hypothetical protein